MRLLYEGGDSGLKAIYQYFLALTAAGLLCAMIQSFLPKDGTGRITRLACGLLLLLVTLRPILHLDADDMFRYLTQLELKKDFAVSGVEIQSRDLTARIISRKLQAYVLDKAAEMGVKIQVEIQMDQRGTWPSISSIQISGTLTTEQQEQLSEILETDLAIPRSRQVFVS